MLSNSILFQPRLHEFTVHDFQPQFDAAITIKAFFTWNANTFQFFIVHEVKGLSPFSLLVQVNLITPILQNEFLKNTPSPSSNCGVSIVMSSTHLKPILTFIFFICFNHFHCMTLFTFNASLAPCP